MKRITNVKRRSPGRRDYRSPLRDERADETRRRILDGLVRTMARGVAGLSMPAVAREAGVSVPTVYRYFGTKAELVAALGPYLGEKSRLMHIPDTKNGLGDMVRELYARHAALDPETRAAMASELGGEVRRHNMPRRIAIIRDALAPLVPGVSGEELDRLTRVMLILMSTPVIQAFKDYLGRDAVVAADDVAWMADALVDSHRRRRR
jgi:AcrR family transcriptional regulator